MNKPTQKAWDLIGEYSHFGINLSLASLRSANSCGIGEFFDLIPLIEWCEKLQFDVIQLLPLNDSGKDPSPYNALSSCALNPVYLSLHALPHLSEELKTKLTAFRELNNTPRVEYKKVYEEKHVWLYTYFIETKEIWEKTQEFLTFIKDNPWTVSYALFKILKVELLEVNWEHWPDHLKNLSPKEEKELEATYSLRITFHQLLQYLLFNQLQTVKKYAGEHKVFLKGDIPILISRDSVDVWHDRSIFNLEFSAGAPPDAYSEEGQYWGFPIFRWDILKQNDYVWWRERIAYASHFYHIYRIDHVVGFFRIWAIPLNQHSKTGKFIPEDESEWTPQGKKILEVMIESSNMLPMAEDLGIIPKEVRPCLEELGICGTKVIRWERNWDTDKEFIPMTNYSPLSLTTLSTHDSEPLALWWKNHPGGAQKYAELKHWDYVPDLNKEMRLTILKDANHSSSLFHINLLQEYLAVFPELVWPDPRDERINIPGDHLPTNWTYRIRPSLEEILAHQELFNTLKALK